MPSRWLQTLLVFKRTLLWYVHPQEPSTYNLVHKYLTLEQARAPRDFAYFPRGVPASIKAEVDANVLAQGFGLLNINQVPFVNVARIYVHDINIAEGTFTTDDGFSRTFQTAGVPLGFRSQVIASQFSVSLIACPDSPSSFSRSQVAKFPSIRGINATGIMSGLFVVSCSDIRDAVRAIDLTKSILPYSTIMPLTGKMYAEQTGGDVDLTSDYEGQMILSIHHNRNAALALVEAAPVIDEIKRLLAQVGDVKAFHTCTSLQTHVRECRVEFFNADHVAVAKDVLKGTVVHVCLNTSHPASC